MICRSAANPKRNKAQQALRARGNSEASTSPKRSATERWKAGKRWSTAKYSERKSFQLGLQASRGRGVLGLSAQAQGFRASRRDSLLSF